MRRRVAWKVVKRHCLVHAPYRPATFRRANQKYYRVLWRAGPGTRVWRTPLLFDDAAEGGILPKLC